jgi:hypothetical protein
MTDPRTRRAPVNGLRGFSIAWWEHESAWRRYGSRYSQDAERIAARGGFGLQELIAYLGHGPASILPDDVSGIESMRRAVRMPTIPECGHDWPIEVRSGDHCVLGCGAVRL